MSAVMVMGRTVKTALALLMVILYALDAVMCQSSIPVISQHPIGSVHREGDRVTLSCMTDMTVELIDWYRDGVKVGSGVEYNIEQFTEVQAGSYNCLATSQDVGTVTSAIAMLELAVFEASPPGEINSPHQQPAQLNQPLTLNCNELISIPPTTYHWRFQDFSIHPEDYAIIGENDGLLYLQLVTEALYEEPLLCEANNPLLESSATGYIQLIATGSNSSSPASPRQMLASPQDVVASVGDTVFFQCIVGGSPVPTPSEVVWSYPTSSRLSQNNAILTVRSATVNDAGVYSCNVTGLGVYSATLTVLVPPILSTPLPQSPQTPIFGDPLSLTCGVDNTLVSQWIWYHNGQQLIETTDNTLTIEEVDSTIHNGIYQCFAYNTAGNISSATSVEVTIIPADLTETDISSPQLVFEGSAISYRCVAQGAPLPDIKWYKDGTQVDIGVTSRNILTRETTSDVEIVDLSVEDSGDYVCRAANVVGGVEVGYDEATAILRVITTTVITTPVASEPYYTLELGLPASLLCEAQSQEGTVLHFTWEKDGNPMAYDDGDRVSLSNDTHSATIMFTSVVEDDAGIYQCMVTTEYEGLEAPLVSSVSINVTAIPEIVIPPKVHPVTEITATSFKVSWYFPGLSAQAKLESYTITCREDRSDDIIFEITQSINEPTEIIISSTEDTPLRPYTVYVVTVWANYASGERLGDYVTVVTSEAKPSPPIGVTGEAINITAILLHWMLPEEPNGIITNYTIRYKQDSTNGFYSILPLSSDDTEHILTPLLQRATYLVQVAASTSVGMGQYSESIKVSTDNSGSEDTPFYKTVWFIASVCVVGVIIVIVVVLISCGVTFARKQNRRYNIQSSVEMKKMNGRSARSLTEDDMMDYNGRGSRMNGDNAQIFEGHETESSLGDKYPYSYEPSLSTTASHISSQAPAYINPPSFQEAIKHGGTLTSAHNMSSAYSGSTLDQPSTTYTAANDSDWGFDSNSKTRMLQLEPSPSPARSYQPSPLHSSSPPPPPPPTSQRPPPPPPLPQSPTHSEHKYASLKDIQRSREQIESEQRYTTSPITANPTYDVNGYNRLPIRNVNQNQTLPQQQTLQYNRASSTTPQYMRSKSNTIGAPLNTRSSSQNIRSTHSTTTTTPPYSVGSQQNMRASTQHIHNIMTQPAPLAKTSSQPNFATFV